MFCFCTLSLSLRLCFFKKKNGFHFRREKQSTGGVGWGWVGSWVLLDWVFLCKSLLHLVTNNTNCNGFLLLMRQIISWLALNVGTLSYWPPLASCFWHFIIPQTMGISINCISHWHLTWFTKHYRSFSVSLLHCSLWIESISQKRSLHMFLLEVIEGKIVYLTLIKGLIIFPHLHRPCGYRKRR